MATQPFKAARRGAYAGLGFDHGTALLAFALVMYWQDLPILATIIAGVGLYGLQRGIAQGFQAEAPEPPGQAVPEKGQPQARTLIR